MLHSLTAIAKIAALVLSLGFDTLAVAIGLGLRGLDRRDQLHYGASFALAEGIMPLVGFLVGGAVARVVGTIAGYVAIAILLAVGLYMLWEAFHEDERELEASSLTALIGLSLSVSMDELAVGFSLGLLHIPVLLAVALIAGQAFVVTWIGTTFGKMLGEAMAERAELLAGTVLSLLAIFLLAEKIAGV